VSGRIVLLVTSPRLPAGLLTAQAWDLLREAEVLAGAESDQTAALRAAGARLSIVDKSPDVLLAWLARHGTVVWLAGPAGDEQLARELGLRLAREPGLAELELLYGSWDPPGARVLDAVTVMDRLMEPDGGDPWKRAQTHQSLAPFLLEEAYEAFDALQADDLDALREELGDVLLQVVLHARLGQDTAGFSLDDVAGDLVEKLIRRNPHVFADTVVGGIDEITANWEEIKKAEKARDSAMDGLALAQPALSLAAKVLQRAERAGLAIEAPAAPPGIDDEDSLARALFALVVAARAGNLDAEAALRKVVLAYVETARRAEAGHQGGGHQDDAG